MNKKIDLTKLLIPSADGPDEPLNDYSCISGNTEILFRNLERRLIQEIKNSEVVLGCVAWLTHFPILKALSTRDSIMVVQKEDFLRPDLYANERNWKDSLRSAYNNLSCSFTRYDLPGVGNSLSTSCDPRISPVRCVGNHNSGKLAAFPRMHNKFLVFCDVEINEDIPEDHFGHRSIVPTKVWTGSFNFSDNATKSFENAVLISDSKIARAFANEFSQIFALSESLDWSQNWVAPEYRIGT